MSRAPLAGRGVVVTRPLESAGGLAAAIERAGGRAFVFPAIEIAEPSDPSALGALLTRLGEFDLAVFASPSAVRRALGRISSWPPGLRAAAVGQGTRRELLERGVADVIAPEGRADSEALLALPQLQAVAGMRIVVFRGEGGRELIAETLAARGAALAHALCYRRTRPAADPAPLLAAWDRGEVDAVTVSSAEAFANLLAMLGEEGERRVRDTPLFVSHPRLAAQARGRGVREVLVAGPSDDEMGERLVAYFGPSHRHPPR